MANIESTLINTLKQQLDIDESEFKRNDNLIQTGLMDSIDLMEFINKIESDLSVEFDHEFLSDNENLTLEKLIQYLDSKKDN